MITNCLKYNKPEAPVIEQARKVRDFFEYRYARIPEHLLNEKLATNQSNSHQNNNSIEHNSHNTNNNKQKDSNKSVDNETSSESIQRMKLLETQVKLLTSTISALTGIDTKQITGKPKNGGLKRNNGAVRRRTSKSTAKKSNKTSAKSLKHELFGDDDDEDDSDLDSPPIQSPIVFNPNDMQDLQQLKTDLENLDGLYTLEHLLSASHLSLYHRILQLNALQLNYR